MAPKVPERSNNGEGREDHEGEVDETRKRHAVLEDDPRTYSRASPYLNSIPFWIRHGLVRSGVKDREALTGERFPMPLLNF